MTDILTLARENGFSHIGFADMAALEPLEEVRKMCSADRCGQWNTNWSCPPACGSIEHAKRRIAQYNKCLLVQTSGSLPMSSITTACRAPPKRTSVRF